MDLQDSYSRKKLLSPEDDWDLIYKEALEARKVLYEAKNKASVKLKQLFSRRILFTMISIILLIIGTFPVINKFFRSEIYQDYLYNFNIVWSVICIGAAIIFYAYALYTNSRRYSLTREIANAEDILEKLDYELFSREDDNVKLMSDTYE